MAIFNLRSIVSSYVSRGLQPDSLRRNLNRQGFSTAGLNLTELFVDATEEFANQAFLEERRSTFIPRPGESMIEREFKEPWVNRYVMRVNFLDPATGQQDFTTLSISSNTDYSIGRAEREMNRYATFLADEGGGSDLPTGVTITGSSMVNAYRNV